MTNAQDWLNQNFPNPESKATIKELLIDGQAKPANPQPPSSFRRKKTVSKSRFDNM